MAEQSTPTGAVFLSYASQDAEAAARICESLRDAGIEVWFDRSDLRGGDAWDAHIKKQIHECALFIPVISAQTNARAEGYFRREWKLATRRLMDLADDAAFLVPVVIDETSEADARVPEEFLDAQWTRLPGGATPPAYAERVRQLLGMGKAIERATHPAHSHGRVPSRARGASRLTRVGVALTAILLVIGMGVFWYSQRMNDGPAAQSAAAVASPGALALNGKSIAVLPFVDLSPSKDQEYFSDGLAEDLLNLLAKLPELRVTSRSSAFAFKGQTLAMSEIAKRLNVAHVLEGSVRKAGNRVRVTAQLIEAHTDLTLWSESFDRDLSDIFAVQDEISAAVVDHLKVSLLGNEKPVARVDARAFDLFLQGRQFARLHTKEGYEKAVELYTQGLAIDGNYAPAWTVLAYCYRRQANNSMRPLKAGYALARDALTRALKIDPDYAPAYAELSRIALDYDVDAAAAARYLERAIAIEPTGDVLSYSSGLAQSLGRFDVALKLGDYALQHDPLNPSTHNLQGIGLRFVGRLDESIAELRKVLELSPGDISAHYRLCEAYLAKGDAKAALAEVQQEPHEAWRLTGLAMSYYSLGRKKESDAALADLIKKFADGWPFNIAYVYAWRGEADLAFKYLEMARIEQDPGLSDVAFEPFFDSVHADPRWLPMLRKLGMAPEQLAAIKFDVKIPGEPVAAN